MILHALISELERLKTVKGPKFLHVITTKGKGLKQAEEDQVKYHAPGKFDAKTGDVTLPNLILNSHQNIKMCLGILLWNWPNKTKTL